jgi:hypothetical protein
MKSIKYERKDMTGGEFALGVLIFLAVWALVQYTE